MIYLAVCDDEKEFVDDIKDRLQGIMLRTRQDYELLDFSTGAELERVVERGQRFDIIFLDIELTDSNGKQVADNLRKLDRLFKLIFVSHHRDEVFEIFSFDASAFIPKNRMDAKFESEVLRILGQIEAEKHSRIIFDVFESKRVKTPIRLDPREIVFFESDKKMIFMHTCKQEQPLNLGLLVMDELEADFVPRGFFRSHRSALVNMDYVYTYTGDKVVLNDGRKIRLSRRRKAELINLIYNKTSR